MGSSNAAERVVWGIVAVLLIIATAKLLTSRSAETQLGMWDADLAGRYQMPSQVTLDPAVIDEVFRDKPLVLVPSPGEAQACRDLFKYYGLDAARLERASRAGNPQGPCGAGQPISVPLDSDR